MKVGDAGSEGPKDGSDFRHLLFFGNAITACFLNRNRSRVPCIGSLDY